MKNPIVMVHPDGQTHHRRQAPTARHHRANERVVGVVAGLLHLGERLFDFAVGRHQRFSVIGEALHQQGNTHIAKQPKRLRHVHLHQTEAARQSRQGVGAFARYIPKARELLRIAAQQIAQHQTGHDAVQLLQAQHGNGLVDRVTTARERECG